MKNRMVAGILLETSLNKKSIIHLCIFFSMFFIFSCDQSNNSNDVLSLLIDPPFKIEFYDYNEGNENSQTALEVIYRFKGNQAEEIESYLIENYGMTELGFRCCGWEQDGLTSLEITEEFKQQYGYLYDFNSIILTMFSDETIVSARNDWKQIPYFYIKVELATI